MNYSMRKITVTALLTAAFGLVSCSAKSDNPTVPEHDLTVTTTEAVTEEITEESELPENLTELFDYKESHGGYSGKAKEWLMQNKDYVGWLRIKDTMVNYPVLIDPGEVTEEHPDFGYYGSEYYVPNSFYLSHYWDKTPYRDGIPFMDWKDNYGGYQGYMSENIVIYGHNMANGNMFGTLSRYRQNPNYFYTSPFVELSTRYGDDAYVIFAFLITPGSYTATNFTYWNMEELNTEEEFQYYVDSCHGRQMLDTGIDVKYGDQLLTLSTCYADYDNSRFIVVARKLREGETFGNLDTIQRTEVYLESHPELKEFQPNIKKAEKED